jgi:hypothetical protein
MTGTKMLLQPSVGALISDTFTTALVDASPKTREYLDKLNAMVWIESTVILSTHWTAVYLFILVSKMMWLLCCRCGQG